METKLKELFISLKGSDKRLKIIIALALVGVMLIMLSELVPKSEKKQEESVSYESYISALEDKTEELISSINGVGRCKVMITLKNTNESVFAKNIEENSNSGNYSKSDEYVLYEGQEGKTPVLIKEYFPDIQGVAVVCDGADNKVVRESIADSISSLYGISVSKISISRYKG